MNPHYVRLALTLATASICIYASLLLFIDYQIANGLIVI